jgi:nucleotide-binding universal stress UspA family protein/uncharacterized protein YjbI with pentapeptide repeats
MIMAKAEHLEILARGVDEWNSWRKENPGIKPDLSEIRIQVLDLRNADLRGADLRLSILKGIDLTGADLAKANLVEADLTRSNLQMANLVGANLARSNLSRSELIRADLAEANLVGANLSMADLMGAKLVGTDLSRANLRQVHLSRADLYKAELVRSDLRQADLGGVNAGANMIEANLLGANLGQTNLTDVVGLTQDMIDKTITDEYTQLPGHIRPPETAAPAVRKQKRKSLIEMKRILWGSDGSKESEEALGFTVFLAKIFSSQIVGIYVSETHIISMFSRIRPAINEAIEEAKRKQHEKFALLKSDLSAEKMDFEGEIVQGEPSRVILELARNTQADLIVMGTRGHGPLYSMLMGVTTMEVLRNSTMPVLAVKKRKSEKKDALIENILIPLDISEHSGSYLLDALDLAAKLNAKATVINVVSFGAYGYTVPRDVRDESLSYASKELENLVDNVTSAQGHLDKKGSKIEINAHVFYGVSPGLSIADYANRNNIDLIVMHTHGIKGIGEFLLGSVTELVIQKAHCSVLAMKP